MRVHVDVLSSGTGVPRIGSTAASFADRVNARHHELTDYADSQRHWDPQLQVSPQAQPARRLAVTFWQPQVQAAPAHEVQLQVFAFFGVFDM
ncbi:MAG: hypothetical protein ABI634_01165 [Acidobacteriota bacterium]